MRMQETGSQGAVLTIGVVAPCGGRLARLGAPLLGLAYALFDVAAHALATADDPEDPQAVAAAIGRTRLETMAGPLDWTAGPVPNVATVRLLGGQWKRGRRHPYELAVVANSRYPDLPREGGLEVLR
ncbi:hypothetical protein [Streptomyces sp. NPDC101150]|uniref:hypothetical protein n=1 Tax=Streptomyces sp. NPDC101150 TaxID=3366114 RepID=UPI0037F8855D